MATALITLTLGLLVLTGLLAGMVASRFGLPRVAAYVLAGMLYSPALLGRIPPVEVGEWAEPLTAIALGLIAYIIGGSITFAQIRRMGKVITGTAFGESFGACAAVFTAVFLAGPGGHDVSRLNLALAFAALAATTAPAGTIAILHQYRAKGPLTSTLLGVVAIDDAIGIILFSLMIVACGGSSLAGGLWMGFREVLGAVALGLAGGLFLASLARRIHQGSFRLPLVLGGILLVLGCANALGFPPLLSAMTLGFACRFFLGAAGDRLFGPVEYFEEFIFIIFFTVAGAHFQAGVLADNFPLVAVYFFARIAGKVGGASLGASLSRAPQTVKRWLGLGLVPQAGVAVGMALTLAHYPVFAGVSSMVINVVLGTTLLYELAGPFAVRYALGRAEEMGERRAR